ncbi:ATPase [Halobacillus halophilus]|uniref:Heavy metal-transporting P-type ATPase n=1 Tax=Halobacillus halophilus (strain ATCC 35676 / DSM 2266 / JCM 20832 / KCTC 3685 / LMG 17431 / NBRC 102448 / NCIMB 2269) TaxID=866895 RepID=I0JKU6_HALH3|nr:cation-translocating P-type ATPase [Halobacillus halophilus]ASF38896.1 ATPase [Halobacillus halophilus]CCG44766.1 heavy metal-transporting P-type ATPase [Halobacillus halophilus DSM 2266]
MEYYQQSTSDILRETNSTKEGLTSDEVQTRLQRDGYNELENKERVPTWKLFIETFKDPMVVVLLAAAGVQIIIGEIVESLIIFLVLLINSVISVVQTRKAESSLESLRDLSAPEANVMRDGVKQTIEARELVMGDLVYLEAGDYVPADGRVLESGSLKANEGMLTGESEAVEKSPEVIEEEVTLGDQRNMVFSSSLVVYGRGTFVVTGTGEETEVGKIADMLSSAEQKETPLQRNLNVFSKRLGIGILILCVLIFAVQAARIWFGDGETDTTTALINALMFSVAIAVAAIPEALQSIVTIVLSVGTNKMAKQHAIIRKLPAVETLGSTSIICTDKTGTLTQNKMTVTDYFLPLHPRESLPEDDANWDKAEQLLVQIGTLCNDSYINQDKQEVGDPTEIALIQFANEHTAGYEQIQDLYPRIAELPFDSERKLMSTVHQMDENTLMLSKGGPDVMFDRASYVLVDGEEQTLTEDMIDRFRKANEDFSKQALRVLALGYKPLPDGTEDITHDDEKDFVLVGLTAMMDPPREEVYDSIAQAKQAGIRPIMITGDHKTTAQAIGREIGLMEKEDLAVTGKELDHMSDEELEQKLDKIAVYARVSPENKIRIVRSLQNRNAVTAMTGDGVNDAPALKQADIGIAMGSGTDVAKDASAMILTDDNFVSIVNAVQVGRTVFDNIKKAISYLFAGNLGAILTILYAVIFNLPNPFTALQLLFINLVNDSLPAIALGVEKSEPNVMKRKPRPVDEGIFDRKTIQAVLTRGTLIAIAVTSSFYIGLSHSNEMGVAMAFTTLILSRTLQTFATRSNTKSAISIGLFSNKYVVGAVALGFVLYGITVLPFARDVFHIPAEFGITDWLIATSLALGAVIMMEIVKFLRYRKK